MPEGRTARRSPAGSTATPRTTARPSPPRDRPGSPPSAARAAPTRPSSSGRSAERAGARLVGVVPGPSGGPGRPGGADDGSAADAEVPGGTRPLPAVGHDDTHDDATPEAAESAFFSGTPEGEERSRAFAGPGQDVIDERERTAEHGVVPDDDEPGRSATSDADGERQADVHGDGERRDGDHGDGRPRG